MNEEKVTFKQKVVNKVRSAYAAAERKVLPVVGAVTVGASALMMNVSAETGAGQTVLAEINSGDVLKNMMPFVNAAIPIMAVVGGVKLGRSFLKSSFH